MIIAFQAWIFEVRRRLGTVSGDLQLRVPGTSSGEREAHGERGAGGGGSSNSCGACGDACGDACGATVEDHRRPGLQRKHPKSPLYAPAESETFFFFGLAGNIRFS